MNTLQFSPLRRAARTLAAVALISVSSRLARAADATSTAPGKSRPEYGYFSAGEPRWFISTQSDLGTPYLKPYLSAGYGKPHWIWAGVDVNAVLTLEMVQPYAGLRASSPLFDLSFGVRDTWSFYRPLLVPAATYSYSDVQDAPGSNARYLAWEAEAVGVVPLPHAALVADLIAVKLLDVPSSRYLYEESYRAVVADGTYAVLRLIAIARLLRENALNIGVLGEHVFETGRNQPVTRLGPVVILQLTDHLQALGTITLPLVSPDSLGPILGSYAIAGLRYRWATGELDPKLPWEGPLIP